MRQGVTTFFAMASIGRFSFLLVSIVLLFALRPFLEPFVSVILLKDIFLSLVLLSTIQAVSRRQRDYVLSIVTGIPALLLSWAAEFLNISALRPLASVLAAIFLFLAVGLILAHLASQKEVTRDMIMGAICAYFLLGFGWAHLFFLFESSSPGAFALPVENAGDLLNFIYYSFVTLTTLGYGDVVPISSHARSLAVLEAAMGQLYIAVTIARLVGMHISQAPQKEK